MRRHSRFVVTEAVCDRARTNAPLPLDSRGHAAVMPVTLNEQECCLCEETLGLGEILACANGARLLRVFLCAVCQRNGLKNHSAIGLLKLWRKHGT